MKRMIVVVAFILAVCAAYASADVPQTISYQGVLTDGAGAAVPDNDYDLTFKIYDVSSLGSPLWTQTLKTGVSGGIFNVVLGPIDLDFDVPYWLGISVNGGGELTPRRELTASPYSLNAQAVKGAENVFPSAGSAGVGTTAPASKLEVFYDNNDSNYGAISIDNSLAGGQDVINFKNDGVTDAQIRYADGGALFLTHFGNNRISFATNSLLRMTVSSLGNVSIGSGYTPSEKLEVDGGIKLGSSSGTSAGTLRWTGSDFEGYDGAMWKSLTATGGGLPAGATGQTLRHNGSDWIANYALTNDGSSIGIGLPSSLSGQLNLYSSASATGMLKLYSDAYGGRAHVYDEANHTMCNIGADVSGTGGAIAIARSESDIGFYVEGNWAGSEEPGVGITGSARSALFRMDQTGSASVVLPADAISSSEMLNEPGVASNTSDASIGLDGTVQTLLARTVNAPASGFVLVIATGQPAFAHTGLISQDVDFGVSDDPAAFPANQDVNIFLPMVLPASTYRFPVTVSGLFIVAAGSNTFYFLGREVSGNCMVYDMQLTCVYFPTSYGVITETLASGNGLTDDQTPQTGGPTAQDLAREVIESQAANQARIDAELAAMREEVEKLKKELRRERQE